MVVCPILWNFKEVILKIVLKNLNVSSFGGCDQIMIFYQSGFISFLWRWDWKFIYLDFNSYMIFLVPNFEY